MMTVPEFFDLFIEELKENKALHGYYKFLSSEKSFSFRKAYFVQRLQFIADNIQDKNAVIWDCGCGYGTTCLFLAMNGIATRGTTLEFYYEQIENRKQYWKKYGNVDLFKVDYEYLFDHHPASESIDYIILQDTLHHLEPLSDALQIFDKSLKKNGKLILVEVNGNCIFERTKFFLMRGNKRIINQWDEKLQKNILIGNENIRSYHTWKKEIEKKDFSIDISSIKYIRLFPPFLFKKYEETIKLENKIWVKHNFIKEYLFFGLNLVAIKK